MKVTIFTDGGSRGNPGPAAIGGVIFDEHGAVLAEVSEYIGSTTNNQAEYKAILATLERAQELGATHADCYLDSLLVVNQMNGDWKIKDASLRAIAQQIHTVAQQLESVCFTHVRREKNTHADALVNKALDAQVI